MPDTARSTIHWLRGCMILIKIASILFLLAGLLYLAIAGANFAVMGAIFFADEQAGTSMIVVYALALFALFFAAGLLGIWATGERVRLHTIIFCVVSALAAIAVFAGIGTGNFSAPESAFGNGIVSGLNLFFGILAVVAAGLGISAIVSENKLTQLEGAALGEEGSEESSADELGAHEGDAPADEIEPADATVLLDSSSEQEGAPADADATADIDGADDEASAAAEAAEEQLAADDTGVLVEAPGVPVEGSGVAAFPEDTPDPDSTAMFIAASMRGKSTVDSAPAVVAVEEPAVSEPQAEPMPGAVPVPRVKRTAMHLPSAQRAAAERPQQPVDDSPIDETEWVDFGSQADDDDEPSGFFGRHMRR